MRGSNIRFYIVRRLLQTVALASALGLLFSCERAPTRQELDAQVRRLEQENGRLKEKTEALAQQVQQALAERNKLEAELRRVRDEGAGNQSAAQSSQTAAPLAPSETSQQPKPLRVIDPDQYKAELNKMKGWTRQQVANRFGNPLKIEGGNWLYRFDARDRFGAIYKSLVVDFDSDGRVFLVSIGTAEP